jgi:hypothetical protein
MKIGTVLKSYADSSFSKMDDSGLFEMLKENLIFYITRQNTLNIKIHKVYISNDVWLLFANNQVFDGEYTTLMGYPYSIDKDLKDFEIIIGV